MVNDKHRLGVSEVTLVVRHLKLNPSTLGDIEAAIIEIDEIYGMDSVLFEEMGHIINLTYDATRTCLDSLEEIFNKYNVEFSQDWWTYIKKDYYRFVDENIKTNTKTEPWSCHAFLGKAPKRKSR